MPGAKEQAVWADGAGFFAQRVQCPNIHMTDCENHTRPADMTSAAALQLRAVLGGMEASIRLHYNRAAVCADITNANPKTQKDLQRVASNQNAVVDKMLEALIAKLQGQAASKPSTPDNGKVWADAATYLSARVQGTASACPGRAADMSPVAARTMQKTLGQIEAFGRLYSNRQTVVQDIVNPSPQTQQNLNRLASTQTAAVQGMVDEVCERLLSKKTKEPDASAVQSWNDAAAYLHSRIQSSASECKGRAPDMSASAAAAMRSVLAQIASKKGN